jgi:hypothetical protein
VTMRSGFPLATYTFTTWLRGDKNPVTGAGNKQPISNGDVGFHFAWDDNLDSLTTAIQHKDTVGWNDMNLGPNLSGGIWYHIAGTYDGTQLCGYRDGAPRGCIAAGPPLDPAFFTLGLTSSVASTFQGRMDEVRISSTARSAAYLAAQYASEADAFITYGM